MLKYNEEVEDIKFILSTDKPLCVGTTVLLTAQTSPKGSALTFQSSDNSVIKIIPYELEEFQTEGSCLLQILDVGKVEISVKSGNLRKFLQLETFQEDYEEPKDKTKMVDLNTDYLRLAIGETVQLQAVTNPANQPVKWRSSDYRIANVEDGGFVTGTSKGTAEVIVSYKTAEAKCIVDVVDLDILGDSFRIGVGQRFRIPIGNYPSTYKILWTSSDDNIAPVDMQGIVTGVKIGEVIINAVVDTETGAISKAINIRVCEWFEPWKYLDSDRMKSLKIFDKIHEVYKYAAGRELRKVSNIEDMPALYYIRTDRNPWLYNYEVVALDDDIQKYLLTK